MTLARSLVTSVLALSAFGCGAISVSSEAGSGNASNQCVNDADCLGGDCVLGTCVATTSVLEKVAIEVIAPDAVSAGEYRKLRYLQLVELSKVGAYNVSLDYVAELTVGMKSSSVSCSYSNVDKMGNLPVYVEVIQDPRVNGIASKSYGSVSNLADEDNLERVRTPPGSVALYIDPTVLLEPTTEIPNDCTLVPLLALGQAILPGNVSFEKALTKAQRLSADISIPVDEAGKSPLAGFVLDIVDPLLGRRLSTQVALSAFTITDGIAHHLVELAYQPVVGEGAAELTRLELFRFTPPVDAVAPSFYVSRLAADLFGTDRLVVNHITTVPTEVVVNGKVESEAGGLPIVSQITAVLRTTGDVATGAIAQFRASTTSDERGRFRLSLVAGEYDVVVTPQFETSYASRVTTWTIAPLPVEQAGKLVSLSTSSSLTGRVSGATEQKGEWSASVVATPSTIGQKNTFIDSLVGTRPNLGRRGATGIVQADGAFELPVDPGSYDVFIRPSDGSGFPWAILPNTVVTEGAVGLGTVRLSAPFTYSGYVTVPGTSDESTQVVLPEALVRAFALLDANGQLVDNWASADTAVQIGETRASSRGEYEILLPAGLE